jgi:hypothetical protein
VAVAQRGRQDKRRWRAHTSAVHMEIVAPFSNPEVSLAYKPPPSGEREWAKNREGWSTERREAGAAVVGLRRPPRQAVAGSSHHIRRALGDC